MQEFRIPSYYYDEDRKLFENEKLVLEDNSITCLIGCNGTGKTTIVKTIEKTLFRRNAFEIRGKYMDFRGCFQDKSYNNEIYISFNKFFEQPNSEEECIFSKLQLNFVSTGEGIISRYGNALQLLGKEVVKPENKGKQIYIFFDDCDAGTSIDVILEIKDVLNLIKESCEQNGLTYYIILTANSYELCRDLDCISVHNFEHKKFNSYEEYKQFVLESRAIKNKELGE